MQMQNTYVEGRWSGTVLISKMAAVMLACGILEPFSHMGFVPNSQIMTFRIPHPVIKQLLEKAFVLILWHFILSCRVAFSQDPWRYTNKDGDDSWFTTRSPIVFEHLGSHLGVDWCYPQDCIMKNKSGSSALLECKKPGYHHIGPITNGSNSQNFRYIHVINSPFYYEWYLAYDKEAKRPIQEELRLWIMDPKHMSLAEKNRTAVLPSKHSKQLTKVFFKLGQKPLLEIKVGYRFVRQDFIIYNQTFNAAECMWQMSTETFYGHQSTVWINGQPTALYDSFIRSSIVPLLITKFSFSEGTNPQVVLRGESQQQIVLVKDPCAPHVAVLISSKVFLTQDNFANAEELNVEASMIQQSEAVVKSIVFSSQNVVVLLVSGRIIVYNGTTRSWNNSSGLPKEGLSGLATQQQCFEGEQKEFMMTLVVGWSNQSDSSKIYFSKDSGMSFEHLAVSLQGFTSISVEHAELHCFLPNAVFLLKPNIPKLVFIHYDFTDAVWGKADIFFTHFIEASSMAFTFLPPSTQFVLVWNRKFAAFGKLNALAEVLMAKNQSQLTNVTFQDSETIVSVISGGLGDFVLQLSSNRIFYGRAHIQHLVEVFPGETSSSNFTFMFDMAGSPLIVTIDGEKVRARRFPLKNEVFSALYPDVSCPYMKFQTSINPKLHYIDKGDEIKVWAQIIYPKTTSNGIELKTSQTESLKITSSDRVEYYQGIILLNKTFAIKHGLKNETFLRTSPYKKSTVAVQLFPTVATLACENSLQVLQIQHGCPPQRKVVIRNCSLQTAVKGSASSNATDGHNQNVCHLSGLVSDTFKLVLDMYDGGKFIKEINTDYMVHEETGRSDFGYTATMHEAGCIREAQTWKKLIVENNTANIYQKCFEPDSSGKAFDGSQSYEVLNSTGVSSLVFYGPGQFQFILKVVDSHLSFCDLTVRFTVDVTGDTASRNFLPQLLSVVIVTVSSTVLLYISYVRYTKQTLNRHQEDEEEQQRLQELKQLFASYQKGQEATVGLSSRRHTGHNVRRFTGTALIMSNQLPEEEQRDPDTILETAEPASNTSLTPGTSFNTSPSVE